MQMPEGEIEEDPQPRDVSPMKTAIEPPQKVVETFETHRGSENSELCMQEMVSPFRQIKLYDEKCLSPEQRSQLVSSSEWHINPVQIKRTEESPTSDTHSPPMMKNVISRLSSPGSPCESPVKNNASPTISPGKLKSQVSKSRAFAIYQLSLLEAQITDNSPSKSNVDHKLIERLKERRKSQNKMNKQQYQESVIQILQKSIQRPLK
jgi:hypothetical protein